MLNERAPKGWSGTTTAMKIKHPEIENPYALSHWLKNKGAKPHYKKTADDTTKHSTVPEKKEKYKDENKPKKHHKKKNHKSFDEWLLSNHPNWDGIPKSVTPQPYDDYLYDWEM